MKISRLLRAFVQSFSLLHNNTIFLNTMAMTAFLSFICATEIPQELEATAALKLQQVCMYRLFNVQGAMPEHREAILTNYGVVKEGHPDVCSWYGVTCVDGLVRAINYWSESLRVHFASTEWFPPTIEEITISPRHMYQALNTRSLPHRLRFLIMSQCDLIGSLALETLPRRMERFRVAYNRFSGSVFLVNLPQSLSEINIQGNLITKAYADRKCFPIDLLLHLPEKCEAISVRKG